MGGRLTGSSRSRRGVLVAVALGAAAVAGAGCGASSTVDPVAQAASSSAGAPGYRMTLSGQISSPLLSAPVIIAGNGSFNERERAGSFQMALNLGNNPVVTAALGASALRVQELFAGGAVYLKLPPELASRIPGTKQWLKIDPAQAANAVGVPGLSSLISGPASSDPSQMLQYLRAVSSGLTDQGPQTIDGFQTSHYRATIQLDRVPALLPSTSRAQAREGIAALENLTHLHQLPVEVWVDREHLVRRMRMDYSVTVPTGQSLSVLMTLDFPQYGPQPAPSLPPADQVSDLTTRLRSN